MEEQFRFLVVQEGLSIANSDNVGGGLPTKFHTLVKVCARGPLTATEIVCKFVAGMDVITNQQKVSVTRLQYCKEVELK